MLSSYYQLFLINGSDAVLVYMALSETQSHLV